MGEPDPCREPLPRKSCYSDTSGLVNEGEGEAIVQGTVKKYFFVFASVSKKKWGGEGGKVRVLNSPTCQVLEAGPDISVQVDVSDST